MAKKSEKFKRICSSIRDFRVRKHICISLFILRFIHFLGYNFSASFFLLHDAKIGSSKGAGVLRHDYAFGYNLFASYFLLHDAKIRSSEDVFVIGIGIF